jgi:FG-GAP-like repeat
MRDAVLCMVASLGFLVSHIFSPEIAHTAAITVVNLDGAGEGFNDPSAPDAASAAGGNGGATLGAQRLIAFQRAAVIWANNLSSPVEIRVDANFNPLTCTSTSATLGSAGTKTVHRDFAGAPLASTWYPQALANSIAGTDLNPTGSSASDIGAQFNSAIGTTCAFPLIWYYGLDGNPPAGTLDFVSVVLHELGHGLGFQSFVDLASGTQLIGFDDVFSHNLENHSTGKLYPQMTDAERVTASQSTGNLHWVGANVVAASGSLTAGVHPSGHVQMYAPNPQQPGSSVSHFDTAVAPNELMEPFYTGANHDVALTLDLFSDLGWALAPPRPVDADFDGEGVTDAAVYQSSSGNWFVVGSSAGFFAPAVNFGGSGYLPVPGDYDGDGETDVAVYQQSTGNWFVVGSTSGFFTPALNFGGAGYIAVPGDYDGDGKTDAAVYQSNTGNWFIVGSTSGFRQVLGFGGSGYVPVPGDYDGDGVTDVAVYQSATGNWFVVGSTAGFFSPALNFGGAGYIPVPGDYDGDGKTDSGVYGSSNGNWFAVGSTSGFFQELGFGGSGYMPVPGDYDGDGVTDVAVYQTSSGDWFVAGTSAGVFTPALNFGGPGFVPVLPQITILIALGLL